MDYQAKIRRRRRRPSTVGGLLALLGMAVLFILCSGIWGNTLPWHLLDMHSRHPGPGGVKTNFYHSRQLMSKKSPADPASEPPPADRHDDRPTGQQSP
ncbi:MAG TPA: hypothetical protein VHC22_14250 [Pirellulales bacterium]|nr:hypothetical protein [Pirellulales bacterium]